VSRASEDKLSKIVFLAHEHSSIESSAEKQLNMTRPDASSEIIIKLL